MARNSVTLTGAAVAIGLALLLCASLLPLILHFGQSPVLPSDWSALRFTVVQAAWSALFSVGLGAILARALFRRQFWGRGVLIRLISAPFLLPSLAAVMGLLVIFGRGGVVNGALALLSLPPLSIFGLHGVVLTHVFLNVPLVTRMVLQGWVDIPAERFRLAQTLGFGQRAMFWHLEWPMLRALLPSAFSAVFLVCLGSFAVALILGGGPRASTLELALYQALRFEFDLDHAAHLALMQIGLCMAAVVLAGLVWRPMGIGAGLDRAAPQMGPRGWSAWVDGGVIVLATAFFIAPLGAVVALGLPQLGNLPLGFWASALRSVGIAVASATLATCTALILAWVQAKGAGFWVELVAMAPLGTSALALGTGAFIALRPWAAPQGMAIPMAIAFGAVLSVPFLFRILLPSCREIVQGYARLSAQIGLSPWREMRWLALPRLARPLGFSMGLATAISMGDFGIIALFGAADHATLPVLIARLMGSYQMAAAASVTLWLVLISFALFWVFDAWGARRAEA